MGGVLPFQEIVRLSEERSISSLIIHNKSSYAFMKILKDQIQPASLDLTVGYKCFRLKSSFLPVDHQVSEALESRITYEFDYDEKGIILEKGVVYLFPLNERMCIPENFYCGANPKSSIGRIDVFARLISDYSKKYDEAEGNKPLYLEVVPLSFAILVKPHLSLNQIRFYDGSAALDDKNLTNIYKQTPLLYTKDNKPIPLGKVIINNGIYLTVDLDQEIVAYKAKTNPEAIIDISKEKSHKKEDFWEPISKPRDGRLILNPGDFILLSTKEQFVVPPEYSAEMIPFEAGSGELRTHYAGFFDPGWGLDRINGTGIPTLEVRARDVPFEIKDGQPICKIVLEKLTEPSQKLYQGNYKNSKGPTLAKFFI